MTEDAAGFSEIGDRYGEQLSRGLALTGESAEYFARRRIGRMTKVVSERRAAAGTILDFGCGTGSSFALLREQFPDARIVGFEPAAGLRELATRAAIPSRAEVLNTAALDLDRKVDVACCNGVFHHIPERERANAMQSIARAVRPGGLVFLWENSPYNPGTRWVMSRIPFDRDARLLVPREMRSLQRSAGLEVVRTEYHFVFPRALSAFRPLEPLLRPLPLGGQYLVMGQRRGQPD